MDPIQGIAKFILGRLEQKILQSWALFLFEMAFSAFVSFCFTCRTVMLSTRSVLSGVASGLIVVAIVLTVFFRTSKLTDGMIAVLPSAEAAEEIATGLQTITKPEEKKP